MVCSLGNAFRNSFLLRASRVGLPEGHAPVKVLGALGAMGAVCVSEGTLTHQGHVLCAHHPRCRMPGSV